MVALTVGMVVLIPFPFSGLSKAKLRPAVVLAYAGKNDWILCQITSKEYSDTNSIELNNNCFKNGLLPIVLSDEIVEQLFKEMYSAEGYQLTIDLAAQVVKTPSGESFSFEVDEFRKHCLLNGLDDIGLTLEHADVIRAYEAKKRIDAPWLFDVVK